MDLDEPPVPLVVPVVLQPGVKLVDAPAVISGGGATVWPSNRYTITNAPEDAFWTMLDTRLEVINLETSKGRTWIVVKVDSPMTCQAMMDRSFTPKMIGGVSQRGGSFMVLVKKSRSSVCGATRMEAP